jgi:hypothetical protein
VIECPRLPAFAPADLDAVRSAFSGVVPCSLRQAWLPALEADFAPAEVRVGWRGNYLLVFAQITDVDILTGVTGLNQRAWELGDTFEMFLRPEDKAAYVEFHVTPNNQRLQLRFADASVLEQVRRTGSINPTLLAGEVFQSRTWVRPDRKCWFVYAEIPATEVGGEIKAGAEGRWRFSFSRYDYTRGRKEPVISSTSPHAEANFHRQQEWGWLVFEP